MTIKTWCRSIQKTALGIVRTWWRPVTCIGIAGGALVNLIIIPLAKWEGANMAEAAAYVAACAAAFAVREVGKKWQTAAPDSDEGTK